MLGCTCSLFVFALLSSQWGLTRSQSDFDDYLQGNQVVVEQLQELYAQGLQSGQALRNIVMDPSDNQAVQNLQRAREAYDAAYTKLSQGVEGRTLATAVQRGCVKTLSEARLTQVGDAALPI